MMKIIRNSKTLILPLLGLLIVVAGCTRQSVQIVGTHKITVARHGFEKKLHSDPNLGLFEYHGVSAAGEKVRISITGDAIKINGVDGRLHPGDSVLIGDEGVAVNSMDYGESEKYMRANLSSTETAARN